MPTVLKGIKKSSLLISLLLSFILNVKAEVIVNPNVIELLECSPELCVIKQENDRLILKKTQKAFELRRDHVLVSKPTSILKNGLLVKVDFTEITDEHVIVYTKVATLNDAIKSGHIKVSSDLKQSEPKRKLELFGDFDSPTRIQKFNLFGKPKNRDEDGYFRVKFSGTIAGIYADFKARIKPKFEFEWQKEEDTLKPKYFKSVISYDLKDLQLAGNVGISLEAPLVKLNLPPITLFVGVPLVLKNSINFKLKTRVLVGSATQGGAFLEKGFVKLGAEYHKESGWKNLTQLDFKPSFFQPGKLNARYKLQVQFPLISIESAPYGIKQFKFYAEFTPIHEVNFTPSINNVLIQSYPRGKVGIKAKLFGFEQDYSYIKEFTGATLYDGHKDDLRKPPVIIPKDSDGNEKYQDIKGNWAYNEIKNLLPMGMLNGFAGSRFHPTRVITRADFARMTVSILNPAPNNSCKNRSFTDVSGHFSEKAINQIARACFTSGFPDGTFRPNNNMTRQEMFGMLAQLPGLAQGNSSDLFASVDDAKDISDWAVNAMATMFTNELMINHPESYRLQPQKLATRSELAAVLYRILMWRGEAQEAFESVYVAR